MPRHAAHTLYCAEWEKGKPGGKYERERVNTDRADGGNRTSAAGPSPLGKLPGSVWTIPSEPLTVPDHVGVDHFAAFPSEWPRRLILGWSPTGWCEACGEPRRAVVERTREVRANRSVESQMFAAGAHAEGRSGFTSDVTCTARPRAVTR